MAEICDRCRREVPLETVAVDWRVDFRRQVRLCRDCVAALKAIWRALVDDREAARE